MIVTLDWHGFHRRAEIARPGRVLSFWWSTTGPHEGEEACSSSAAIFVRLASGRYACVDCALCQALLPIGPVRPHPVTTDRRGLRMVDTPLRGRRLAFLGGGG